MGSASGFFRLHERLRHAIVHTLGWRELRPVQELAVEAILDGNNAIVLAPTAGGKTEAGLLPALDLLMRRPARGVGVLYLSPLRALLNNQEPRVDLLARMARMDVRRRMRRPSDPSTPCLPRTAGEPPPLDLHLGLRPARVLGGVRGLEVVLRQRPPATEGVATSRRSSVMGSLGRFLQPRLPGPLPRPRDGWRDRSHSRP